MQKSKIKEKSIKQVMWDIIPSFLLIGIFIILFFVFSYCYHTFFYPLKYTAEIKQISQEYNVNAGLVASIIKAESGFNSSSISNAGAIGLMQLMPQTANYIAMRTNLQSSEKIDLLDVQTNLKLGVAYISYLSSRFDDTFTLLCAYNAGEGNVQNWLKDSTYSLDGKKLTSTPYKQTNYYAHKVLRNIPHYEKRLDS